METGVMSSGGGEAGELVKEGVQIQRTPAADTSVQVLATLADFVPRNNVGRARAGFPGAAARREKSVSDPVLISVLDGSGSSGGGACRALKTMLRAASCQRRA